MPTVMRSLPVISMGCSLLLSVRSLPLSPKSPRPFRSKFVLLNRPSRMHRPMMAILTTGLDFSNRYIASRFSLYAYYRIYIYTVCIIMDLCYAFSFLGSFESGMTMSLYMSDVMCVLLLNIFSVFQYPEKYIFSVLRVYNATASPACRFI